MKIFFCFVIIISLAISCSRSVEISSDKDVSMANDSIETIEFTPEFFYGIPEDGYEIVDKRVRSNETLAKLLYNTGIPSFQVNELVNQCEKIFESRKIKAGNHYYYFYPKENETNPAYFIYEIDNIEYLRFSLTDSLYVNRIKKETDTISMFVAFSIKSSLWETMIEKKLNPMLAINLSEIYAWTIDFFGLQLGDSVRVTYKEITVDGQSIGIDKVESVCFRHMNHDYYAVLFNQDGKEGYFDLEGNSLRKAFLKAPLRFSRISSKFSNSRLHPILKIRRPHYGVDYAAPVGTPVQSIGDGVVISVTNTGGSGKMVKIRHNSVYTTAYLHLKNYGKGIQKGTHVNQGQVIGYVGSSGLSSGPHLDFRIYKNGSPVDPLKIESPSVEPIKKENIPIFNEKIYLALKQLGIEQTYLAVTGVENSNISVLSQFSQP